MALTSEDFANITDYLNEIFVETANVNIARMGGLEVFGVKDTPYETYEYQIIHGLSGIQEVAEGEDFPEVTSDEGKTIALFKSILINGETLKIAVMRFMETLRKAESRLQRLSEWTPIKGEATV